MKFKIQCVCEGKDPWWEEYDEDVEDPIKWAEETIEWFNSTLRPYEKPRKLLDLQIVDNKQTHHKWTKRTDGMSMLFKGQVVDLMYCEKCGITGKRIGLSRHVKIDSMYRKKVFKTCDTAAPVIKSLDCKDGVRFESKLLDECGKNSESYVIGGMPVRKTNNLS